MKKNIFLIITFAIVLILLLILHISKKAFCGIRQQRRGIMFVCFFVLLMSDGIVQ